MKDDEAARQIDKAGPLIAALFLLAAVFALMAAPSSEAAQRGYTFENVDRMADRFLPVLKARMGCPESWDATRPLDECRAAAAHKDLDAYDKAGKAARRLWP